MQGFYSHVIFFSYKFKTQVAIATSKNYKTAKTYCLVKIS